jgi:hypothetical protein
MTSYVARQSLPSPQLRLHVVAAEVMVWLDVMAEEVTDS